VHPVHVEAVANVVGQSELWVGLLTLAALAVYVRRRNAGEFTPAWQGLIVGMVLAACFFKEHGVVIPPLLLLAELVVVRDPEPVRRRFVRLRPFALGLAAALIAYLGVRVTVLPHLSGFTPYVPFDALGMTDGQRQITMIGLVPEWVRLLLYPARLSAEYGPPAQPLLLGFDWSVIPGALILVAVLGLAVLSVRRHPVVSFGIGFLVLTLLPTSNFLVASGILMAERTLYLPSAGAMLALAAGVPYLALRIIDHPVRRRLAAAGLMAVLAAGAWRSHTRTQVWESNDRLIVQSALDAPDVYRAHYMLGAYHFGHQRWRLGEDAFRKAVRLFPQDPFVAHNLGEQYRKRNLCMAAIPYYQHAVSIAAGFRDTRARLAVCLFEVDRLAESRVEAWRALREGIGPPGHMIALLRAISEAEAGRSGQGSGGLQESGKVPDPAQKTVADSLTQGRS
jgi:protein O-mannosyl-transferase